MSSAFRFKNSGCLCFEALLHDQGRCQLISAVQKLRVALWAILLVAGGSRGYV